MSSLGSVTSPLSSLNCRSCEAFSDKPKIIFSSYVIINVKDTLLVCSPVQAWRNRSSNLLCWQMLKLVLVELHLTFLMQLSKLCHRQICRKALPHLAHQQSAVGYNAHQCLPQRQNGCYWL